jgi:hypothetical protein
MTLSFLAFPPELRNQVYELLVAENCKFSRANFPSHHVPEDGMYDPDVDSDDDDDSDGNDDSDMEMDDAPIIEEEAMELGEDVKSLTARRTVPPRLGDGEHDSDLEYDDGPPKGYELYDSPDRDQCESVRGCLSIDLACPLCGLANVSCAFISFWT